MAVTGTRVLRFTADNDVYDSGLKKLSIKGVRLVSGTVKSTAQLKESNTNGQIVYALAAVADAADESNICHVLEGGVLHLDISGAGAEVFVYLD